MFVIKAGNERNDVNLRVGQVGRNPISASRRLYPDEQTFIVDFCAPAWFTPA
jgi:hypothetical protein